MLKVGILGATGLVGQRFIELLQSHPWFKVKVLAASQKSAGKEFSKATQWKMTTDLSEEIAEMTVVESKRRSVEEVSDIDIIFSALPSNIAKKTELEFTEKYPVISKASAYRMEPDIPLLIPEVNPEHLELIPFQQENREFEGFICTDPNCSTIQIALSLKPLQALGLQKVIVSTMQAISGAGYPGLAALDYVDNVVPFIKREEEKIELESKKILGIYNNNRIDLADILISASCNRVSVENGHLATIFVELEDKISSFDLQRIFENYQGEPQTLNLPTAPERPLIVRKEVDRPQPKLDRNAGRGMSVVLGRIREDPIFTLKYVCLGHNTIRGAAGAGVLSAELLTKKGHIN
jgi:aspartate-semialdehyde dehydrogenase